MITYKETGKVICGTWELDKLNGQGTISPDGDKDPVEVLFKDDIVIQQAGQLFWQDYLYVFTSVLFLIAFYASFPLAIFLRNSSLFAIAGVWLLYLVYSCLTNSTKYINNTVDLTQVFININNAILARPIVKFHI